MDRARIEDISAKFSSKVGLASTDELIEFAHHIAKLARAEALEDAAKICDKQKGWSATMASTKIRALKRSHEII